MNNKRLGNGFETEFCELLYDHGFWAHNMIQDASGQPADVIAVKGNYHCLIDCKVVSTSSGFVFSRWEDNQRSAMRLFRRRGYCTGWLAIRLPDGNVRMLSAQTIEALEEDGKHSISLAEMPKYADPFTKWVEDIDETNLRWRA